MSKMNSNANSSNANSNSTIIKDIPSFSQWQKGVNVELIDDITPMLSASQKADPTMKAKIGALMSLRKARALNEARQQYLNNLRDQLLDEVHSLKNLNSRTNKMRIQEIEGIFEYRSTVLRKRNPDGSLSDEPVMSKPDENGESVPVTRMMRYRLDPKPGQSIGRYAMKKPGLITQILDEVNDYLYPELDRIHHAIEKVRGALEQEIGRPLKANLVERNPEVESAFARLRELFPDMED